MHEAIMTEKLEELYERYNRRECVHPDPLEFLYDCDHADDGEVVGLVASSLAYGRVAQILRSVGRVLDLLGPSPAAFVDGATKHKLVEALRGFRHRFTSGEEIAALLAGIAGVRRRHGSLQASFMAGMNLRGNLQAALSAFVAELGDAAGRRLPHLLPSPADGSACKRLNLFLRWMVRHDNVDPGGWDDVPASMLMVPLDVHMHRIGCELGFTGRAQANWRAAEEVTTAFRRMAPADPVRYDFALTRLGMHSGVDLAEFLNGLKAGRAMSNA